MIQNLSSKTFVVIDRGIFFSIAQRIARDVSAVYFCNPDKLMYPTINHVSIGAGFDDVELISDFWDKIDKRQIDCCVFPDIHDGGLQNHLRSLGVPVWGCGHGDDLESYRDFAKEVMKEVGLPVNDYTVVQGITELREYLKKHENVHIKVNYIRGSMETWHSVNYELSEPYLNELQYYFGAMAEEVPFVVEEAIDDAVEAGYDGYCIDGQFPDRSLFGYEVKDKAYIETMIDYSKFPDVVRNVNDKLAPKLAEYKYRSALSTEIRNDILLDLTCRLPSPPNESYQELFTNISEIIYQGAQGILVNPITEKKFTAQCVISSPFAGENWQPIHVPKENRQWVKLYKPCMINDVLHSIPMPSLNQFYELGYVVGLGDTIEEAVEDCVNHAEGIEGYELKVHLDYLPKAVEEIQKGKEQGMEFGDEKIPDPKEIEI